MRRARALVRLVVVLAAAASGALVVIPGAQALPRWPGRTPVVAARDITLDTETLALRLGERFSFTSTIRTDGSGPSSPVIAHLNLLSLDPGVYVDPEDWSAERTRYLGSLPSSSVTALRWNVQAVNSGDFLAYVTLTEPEALNTVAASPVLRLEVAPQPRLTGTGALPLAVGVPGVLLMLSALATWRRRARSRPRTAAVAS